VTKVFLTGSSGFIGKEVLRLCDTRGIEVVGVDAAQPTRPDCFIADIRDPSIVDVFPHEVDAIIHLAGLSRDADCRDNARACFEINVMGTLNLIEAAKAKSAKQFIFASTEWVYDSFERDLEKTENSSIDASKLDSEYAFSKLTSENNLRQKFQHGFCPTTVLRFGIVYGPRTENWSAVEAILNSVATQPELTVGSLRTGRCFVHVTDIARGILAAIGCPGYEIVNLQSPQFVCLEDVITAAKDLTGKSPSVLEGDAGNPSIRRVSSEKADRLLGWHPDHDIESGMATVASFLGLTV